MVWVCVCVLDKLWHNDNNELFAEIIISVSKHKTNKQLMKNVSVKNFKLTHFHARFRVASSGGGGD